jgi:hypothetical protein
LVQNFDKDAAGNVFIKETVRPFSSPHHSPFTIHHSPLTPHYNNNGIQNGYSNKNSYFRFCKFFSKKTLGDFKMFLYLAF